MGSITTILNPLVPVPPSNVRRRRWVQVGQVVRFRSGLCLKLYRARCGDTYTLGFYADVSGQGAVIDLLAGPVFRAEADCYFVVRAVAFSGEKPRSVLIEVRANPDRVAMAMEVSA